MHMQTALSTSSRCLNKWNLPAAVALRGAVSSSWPHLDAHGDAPRPTSLRAACRSSPERFSSRLRGLQATQGVLVAVTDSLGAPARSDDWTDAAGRQRGLPPFAHWQRGWTRECTRQTCGT